MTAVGGGVEDDVVGTSLDTAFERRLQRFVGGVAGVEGKIVAKEDEAAAQAEYERAAEIYAQQGHPVEQADILVRIAVQLTMQYDRRSGCNLLGQAAGLDPANSRIPILLRNFDCIPRTVIPPTTITPTAGNPVTATPNSAPTPEPTNATP